MSPWASKSIEPAPMATMKGLVSQVAKIEIGAKKFATKEANFMGSQILYTLEQCTPDIYIQLCLQYAYTASDSATAGLL